MALSIAEINAVTTPHHRRLCVDNAYESHVILDSIRTGKRVLYNAPGGTSFRLPVRYKELGDAESIDPDAGRVTVGRQTRTALDFDWKYYKVDMPLTWQERSVNQGNHEMIVKLATDKIIEGKQDMAEIISDYIFQSLASIGGNDIRSLYDIIQDPSSSSSYGGLSGGTGADAPNWQAGMYDVSTTTLALHGTTGSLWYLYESVSHYGLQPDAIFTTMALAGIYASKLQPGERRKPEDGKAGAVDHFFNGVPFYVDRHVQDNHLIMGCLKSLWLGVIKGDEFALSDWDDDPDTYKGIRCLLTFVGALACDVRRSWGVFTSLTS
jgi:hypothetical protein